MSNIAPRKPASKNLTRAKCEARVTRRTKTYDAKVTGLYVSASPTSPATFFLKFTATSTHKRQTIRIGTYHADTFNVDHARTEALHLKARIGRGEDVARARRDTSVTNAKHSLTVNQLVDLRIAWISEDIELRRAKDGVTMIMGPRLRAWKNLKRHLDRFVRPRLGRMIASEVTRADIMAMHADLKSGAWVPPGGRKRNPKSSHRAMRKAVCGTFSWALRHGYVSSSPTAHLPPLDPEVGRKRVLTVDEIRILWHGLDRPDLNCDRKIRLALKFALLSALRSVELLGIHRDELGKHGLASKTPLVVVGEERVKLKRAIHQPLSDLAVEIAKEALGNHHRLFASPVKDDAPLHRSAMANALRGLWFVKDGKRVVRADGICKMLGIAPFVPHDLRRTAASLMGSMGIPRSTISLCLDHSAKVDDNGLAVAAVTGLHYDHDPRIAEKRAALQKLADRIREIVDAPVQAELRQAA